MLNPETREEFYLAKMAGEDVTLPDPITREEQYLEKVADRIDEAGSELPKVTGDDAGKVLTVSNNGKWIASDGLGYTVAIATSDGTSFTTTATYDALVSRMLDGQPISGTLTFIEVIGVDEYSSGVYPLATIELGEESVTLYFRSVYYDSDEAGLYQTYYTLTLDSENSITIADSGEDEIPLGS